MAVSPEFQAFVAELLAPVGPFAIRRMFGGAGAFYDDVMFALIIGEVLYFKVDDTNRPDFEAAGKGPFSYDTKHGRRALGGYFELPDEIFETPDEFAVWARRSIDVALRAQAAPGAAKRPKRRRRSD